MLIATTQRKKLPRTCNTGTFLDADKIQAWLGWQAAGETIRVSTGKEPAVQGAVTHLSTRWSNRDLESTRDFMTTTKMLKNIDWLRSTLSFYFALKMIRHCEEEKDK